MYDGEVKFQGEAGMTEDGGKKNSDAPDEWVGPGDLVRSDFTPFIGRDFTVPVNDQEPLVLTLAEIFSMIDPGKRRDGGFILRFSGPMDRYFMQGAVPLTFPDGRTTEIFIVNNGPKNSGMSYRAVIS